MERVTRIALASPTWKDGIFLLDYTRKVYLAEGSCAKPLTLMSHMYGLETYKQRFQGLFNQCSITTPRLQPQDVFSTQNIIPPAVAAVKHFI